MKITSLPAQTRKIFEARKEKLESWAEGIKDDLAELKRLTALREKNESERAEAEKAMSESTDAAQRFTALTAQGQKLDELLQAAKAELDSGIQTIRLCILNHRKEVRVHTSALLREQLTQDYLESVGQFYARPEIAGRIDAQRTDSWKTLHIFLHREDASIHSLEDAEDELAQAIRACTTIEAL